MNKKTLALVAVFCLVSSAVVMCAMMEDSDAADYTGNTYSVKLLEGQAYSYTPSFSLVGVTVTISGTATSWLSVSGITISGTAPAVSSGNSTYTLEITASTVQPTQTAKQYITFTVYDTLTISGTSTFAGSISGAVNLTSTSNLAGTTWTATNLPAGLSINASTGTIIGTPSAAGSKTATITGTHSDSNQVKTYTINFAISTGLSVSSAAHLYCVNGKVLPTSAADPDYYKFTANLTGVTFAIKSGAVSGITVNSDGRVTGTPVMMGNHVMTITATETSTGQKVDFNLTVHIVAPLIFDVFPEGGILVEPI